MLAHLEPVHHAVQSWHVAVVALAYSERMTIVQSILRDSSHRDLLVPLERDSDLFVDRFINQLGGTPASPIVKGQDCASSCAMNGSRRLTIVVDSQLVLVLA